jgi:hypothetical protein
MKSNILSLLVFTAIFAYTTTTQAQVGIGTASPNASAQLEISSSSKGFLPPRVTLTGTADATTIASPATGLMVYNTATAGTAPANVTPGIYYYDGSKWQRVINQQPDATVEFDKATPTTTGVVFTPNTPTSKDVIYVSTVDNSQWTYNGTAYVTFTPPASTAWMLSGGTSDAGSNKSSAIYRSGKVGIGTGTTAPTAGLEILTDGSALNALRVSSNQAYNSSPDAGIGFRFKYNTAGDYTSGAVISGIKENATDGNQSGSLRFMTNSAGTIAERMRISSSGSVGIGNTAPNARLDIRTNPTSTSDPGAGYLGIGTTSTAANTAGAGAIRYSTSSGGELQYSNGVTWNTLSSNVQKSVVAGYFSSSSGTGLITLGCTETQDRNGDFASNEFTAPRTGLYLVTVNILTASKGWSVGEELNIGAYRVGTSTAYFLGEYFAQAAITTFGGTSSSCVVSLTAGDKLNFRAYTLGGFALYGQNYNQFSITEL